MVLDADALNIISCDTEILNKKKNEIVQKLKKGYEEMAEFNLEYSDFCFESDNRQLQLYEEKLAECE